MIKIGITGGIGSGKSTVCSLFQVLGIPVYNADNEAKNLMVNDIALKNNIINLMGPETYINGELNREFIASKVFKDTDLLKKLNDIVHPAVKKNFIAWSESQKAPYVIYEAALMIESGSYKLMDKIIVVAAPMKLRIARVCLRDNASIEKVKERINNQLTQKNMLKYSDHVITNDGKKSLIKQVIELHLKFKN